MLNLYDPATSPSTVVVKLLTGRQSRSSGKNPSASCTQSQVLYLLEPVADQSVGGGCQSQAIRRAA